MTESRVSSPAPISLQAERLLIAFGESVAEACQRDGDGSSEEAEIALRNYIASLEKPAPSVSPYLQKKRQ